LEILGLFLQSKADFSSAYRLLLKQSNIHGKIHETLRKFILRNLPYPKAPTVSMLCPSDSIIWFLTLVLQQGFVVIPHEDFEQNAKKSCYLDFRGFQNITLRRN